MLFSQHLFNGAKYLKYQMVVRVIKDCYLKLINISAIKVQPVGNWGK